jgi:hypothetical protein
MLKFESPSLKFGKVENMLSENDSMCRLALRVLFSSV